MKLNFYSAKAHCKLVNYLYGLSYPALYYFIVCVLNISDSENLSLRGRLRQGQNSAMFSAILSSIRFSLQ